MYHAAYDATFVEPWQVHLTTNVLVLLLQIIWIVDVLYGLTISWSTLMELTRFVELGVLAEKTYFSFSIASRRVCNVL